MELFEAIKTRRSVRHYRPDPVDDKIVQAVLEAARWAPSWKNTQCWRFVVVRDSRIRAGLAATMNKIEREGKLYENPAGRAIMQAPVTIVVCAELGKSGLKGLNINEFDTDKGDWYMFDTALAMQNLLLAAHAQGLGTVCAGLFDAKKVAEILGVPDGTCVVAMTPLGYPDTERPARTPPRKDLSEIVFYDKYGS